MGDVLEPVELIGYLASIFVVVGLSMASIVRLRMFSLAGSVTFLVYGALIGSVPLILTNLCIAVLNIWFLVKELGGRRDLGAVIVPPNSPFLLDFLGHHHDEICRFQPDYDDSIEPSFALVLTRDGLPAGVLLGQQIGSRLHVELDFVLRAYRDSSIGRWLYGPGATVFRSAGIDHITATALSDPHRSYLDRVGFVDDPASPNRLVHPL